MKNTDKKLIAAAVTYATIPTFKGTVDSVQQGFVPGRNSVRNVVQLDFESRVNALRCLNDRNADNPECMLPPHSVAKIACTVSFDFAALSPRCSKLGSSRSFMPSRLLRDPLILSCRCIPRTMHTS